MIVSVPNAFSLTGLFSFARGVESVHPDHNFYFSRTTLRTLLAKNGLSVLKEYVYVFDVDYLPTRRLEGALFFDGTGQIRSHPVLPSARRLLGRRRGSGSGGLGPCGARDRRAPGQDRDSLSRRPAGQQ